MSESQTTKIIKMLKTYPKLHWGKGVPNYKFAHSGILDYTARISELRKDGYNIVAEREIVGGRASNTFRYYLTEEPQ